MILQIICFLFGSFLIGNAGYSVFTGSFYDTEYGEWTSRAEKPMSFWLQVVLSAALGVLFFGVGIFR
jgi:hypothetical protein